jgi:NTP pyrophosphatase (non-canonical NTP hydrolase)
MSRNRASSVLFTAEWPQSGSALHSNETLGKLTEEYAELINAIHVNRSDWTIDELFDIAILAVWGILSEKS